MKIRLTKKYTLNLNQFAVFVSGLLTMLMLGWIVTSYIEIMLHADDAFTVGNSYQYSNSNLIYLLTDLFKKLFA